MSISVLVNQNDKIGLTCFIIFTDWFFNPTYEDNYPTVNLEARACGCRIVTYDTGGSRETVEGYDKAWVLKGEDKSPDGFLKVLNSRAYE